MKYLFVIFCLLFIDQLFGQNQKSLILTKENNYLWIEQLRTLKFEEKILELKERIMLDTNTVFNQCCVDGLTWTKPNNKEITECKPTINIGGIVFHFTNEVRLSSITEFVSMLSPKKFKDIRIYTNKDKIAYEVYGMVSECGIIILDPKNNRIKRKFNRLEL